MYVQFMSRSVPHFSSILSKLYLVNAKCFWQDRLLFVIFNFFNFFNFLYRLLVILLFFQFYSTIWQQCQATELVGTLGPCHTRNSRATLSHNFVAQQSCLSNCQFSNEHLQPKLQLVRNCGENLNRLHSLIKIVDGCQNDKTNQASGSSGFCIRSVIVSGVVLKITFCQPYQ